MSWSAMRRLPVFCGGGFLGVGFWGGFLGWGCGGGVLGAGGFRRLWGGAFRGCRVVVIKDQPATPTGRA
ncbi:hypothetical protein DN402_02515 [Streptomyces sp. SW4]|nr:hypothetical protein DN402_02515 [Streptomyces sp. SW4]